MWRILFIYLFQLPAIILSEEDSLFDNFKELLNVTGTVSSNITVQGNSSIEMERITKPSQTPASSQQINRSLAFPSNKSVQNERKSFSDFRPSPQLETYYEYNKFPVIPALPEAKHFSSLFSGENAIRGERLPWVEKLIPEHTTGTPWVSKIRFPTQAPTVITVNDHPYPFEIHNEDVTIDKSQIKIGETYSGDYDLQKGVGSASPPIFGYSDDSIMYKHRPVLGSIDKFEKETFLTKKPMPQKLNYEYSLEEKPKTGISMPPWKNIVKFLTAAIPIGILISALTPTVINVTPMNMTQNRARLEENESRTKHHLITSLNYVNALKKYGCEERILCELLISAGSSKNAEQYADNLLDIFTQQKKSVHEKTESLKKIMEAVRKNKCNAIECNSAHKKGRDN